MDRVLTHDILTKEMLGIFGNLRGGDPRFEALADDLEILQIEFDRKFLPPRLKIAPIDLTATPDQRMGVGIKLTRGDLVSNIDLLAARLLKPSAAVLIQQLADLEQPLRFCPLPVEEASAQTAIVRGDLAVRGTMRYEAAEDISVFTFDVAVKEASKQRP